MGGIWGLLDVSVTGSFILCIVGKPEGAFEYVDSEWTKLVSFISEVVTDTLIHKHLRLKV
jgi:hypothetical protein